MRTSVRMDKDSLKVLLAQGLTISQIAQRFGKARSTIAYWMEAHGLETAHPEKRTATVTVDRERLEAMIAAGMPIVQMAAELEVSSVTVRRRLARYGLRTQRTARERAAASARASGNLAAPFVCDRHGETEFILEGRGYYRCKRCRSERVAARRRNAKVLLVGEAGGRCCLCGYDRYIGALEFHHLDPSEKRFEINTSGATVSLDALRAEARKCVLLCSNCHSEVENGMASVPGTVSGELAEESRSRPTHADPG
jgi:transposase